MANRALSGLTGTRENGMTQKPAAGQNAGSGGERGLPVRSDPTAQGLMINYNGPRSHTELLEFYFGHPTSVAKNSGAPKRSQW